MKNKHINAFMRTAFVFAELSTAKKLKVGSIIVKEDRIISIGYNGTPAGWDNTCEENGMTKLEVIHAEANCIAKLASSSESGKDSVMFVTHEPCIHCAKIIYGAGIKHVYYSISYTSSSHIPNTLTGLEFLNRCNITTTHWRIEND
jgi:dCMP deaminase